VSAEGGTKAVVAALTANIFIAVTKFTAWALTGASSMLAEAIHSVADSGNQVLLLVGGKRAKREATPEHPFGYGRERYVFGFIVAVVLFSVGGLFAFYEIHDPTQGMRQGNDTGTQYRSGIYTYNDDQKQAAESSREMYQGELTKAGHGEITTEIEDAGDFYYAEEYHQQYLHKVPNGYCGLGGMGVSCPIGLKT